jgi:signal transduction histidine kinase
MVPLALQPKTSEGHGSTRTFGPILSLLRAGAKASKIAWDREGGLMSAATAAGTGQVRRPTRGEPFNLRLLELSVSLVVLSILAWQIGTHWETFTANINDLLPWLLVVALADLLPVPIWGSVELMMSFPVLLAAGLVFPPFVAGSLSLVGTLDLRELRREISPLRGLYNRCNVAASVMAASWAFHLFGVGVLDWPQVIGAALVALVADMLVNFTLVIAGTHLLMGLPAVRLLNKVYGGSHPEVFLGGYACFGLLAVLMATVYVAAGNAGLIAFAIPLLLARQMFVHWKRLGEANVALIQKDRALTAAANKIADERREERLALAAEIHDEVLPPLYKIHLIGQVVRSDFASGRLLDLEADVPDLLQAVETANSALREMVRDLRQSAIGPGGLVATLQLLAEQIEATTQIRVKTDLRPVGGSALTHLLTYQLAREAVANAARHSGASTIVMALDQDEDSIRLRVSDDGEGFNPLTVDASSHFGLQLMRERSELAGGSLVVSSARGEGTLVLARLPIEGRIRPGPN